MKISDIKIDYSLNPRTELNENKIIEYMEVYDSLPGVILQYATEPPYKLIDGFHRIEAAKRLGKERLDKWEMVKVPDNELFAESVRRNLTHGLSLSKEERDRAIVQLYDDGWTQQRISEFLKGGLSQQHISSIINAHIRNKTLDKKELQIISKITPVQENLIRSAPKDYQDDIAEVVATRKSPPKESDDDNLPLLGDADTIIAEPEKIPRPKSMRTSEVRTLVNQVKMAVEAGDSANADKLLHDLKKNPADRPVGMTEKGGMDGESIARHIREAASTPSIGVDISEAMLKLSKLNNRYSLEELGTLLMKEPDVWWFRLTHAIEFLNQLLELLPPVSRDERINLKEAELWEEV